MAETVENGGRLPFNLASRVVGRCLGSDVCKASQTTVRENEFFALNSGLLSLLPLATLSMARLVLSPHC